MKSINFSAQDYRKALANFATGVAVVTTTSAERQPVGITVSSFNSVSMQPPLVLWSLSKSAKYAGAFRAAKHQAIHVLASHQLNLCYHFANREQNKFDQLPHYINSDGVPILPDMLTVFECRRRDMFDGGDHWIFLLEVNRLTHNRGNGLLFFAGQYRQTSAMPRLDSGPVPDDRWQQLLQLLNRTVDLLNDKFAEQLQQHNMTIADWLVLLALDQAKDSDYLKLAKFLATDSTAIKHSVATLQQLGLCHLLPAEQGETVGITAAGKEMLQQIVNLREQLITHILDNTANTAAAEKNGADYPEKYQQLLELLQSISK